MTWQTMFCSRVMEAVRWHSSVDCRRLVSISCRYSLWLRWFYCYALWNGLLGNPSAPLLIACTLITVLSFSFQFLVIWPAFLWAGCYMPVTFLLLNHQCQSSKGHGYCEVFLKSFTGFLCFVVILGNSIGLNVSWMSRLTVIWATADCNYWNYIESHFCQFFESIKYTSPSHICCVTENTAWEKLPVHHVFYFLFVCNNRRKSVTYL